MVIMHLCLLLLSLWIQCTCTAITMVTINNYPQLKWLRTSSPWVVAPPFFDKGPLLVSVISLPVWKSWITWIIWIVVYTYHVYVVWDWGSFTLRIVHKFANSFPFYLILKFYAFSRNDTIRFLSRWWSWVENSLQD